MLLPLLGLVSSDIIILLLLYPAVPDACAGPEGAIQAAEAACGRAAGAGEAALLHWLATRARMQLSLWLHAVHTQFHCRLCLSVLVLYKQSPDVPFMQQNAVRRPSSKYVLWWLCACVQVVLPQLCFDDEDAELWEEDPQEFVRKVSLSVSL